MTAHGYTQKRAIVSTSLPPHSCPRTCRWDCGRLGTSELPSAPGDGARPACYPYTGAMSRQAIVEAIDAEIQRLQQAKELLSGKRALIKGKRTMSPESRARIAAGQKASWAKRTKSS